VDCTLLADKMVRDFKKKDGSRACFKVDLKKSFDNVNRDFVLFIMRCMGFSYIWINWIRQCITSIFSILIKGSSLGFFSSSRGSGEILYLFISLSLSWNFSALSWIWQWQLARSNP